MKQIDKREALLIFTLIGLVCFSTTSAVAVHAPVLNDHTIHLAKLALLKEQVLTDHRWWGWTHELLFGYPLNYTYPYLGYALILAIDFLTGPLLSLDGAYLVFLNLIACVLVLSVYLWSKRVSGTAAATLASILVILDKGGPHYGGYQWYSVIGVWACELSLALFMLFLYLLTNSLSAKGLSKSVLAGVLLGFSLLSHPISGVALAPALLAYAVTLVGTKHLKEQRAKSFFRLGLTVGIGLAISAIWIFPYLSVKSYTLPFSNEWLNFTQIVAAVAEGKFAYMSSPLLVLGLLGFLYNFSKNDKRLHFVALFPLFTMILGSNTFLNATGLIHIFQSFEMVRLQIFIRPFFAIAAGTVCWAIYDGLLRNHNSDAEQPTTRKRPLFGLAIAVFFVGLLIIYGQQIVELRDQWNPATEPAYSLETRESLVSQMKLLLAKEEGFVRVHFAQAEQRPRTYMDLCRDLKIPVSFEPFYPATNVKYGNSRGVERVGVVKYGVRMLITDQKLVGQEGWEPVAQSEPWYVYRYDRPELLVQPFRAEATIRYLRMESNEIRFRVADVKEVQSDSELRVFMTPFPRWELSINGHPASWELVEKEGYPDGFFSLPLEEGDYTLSFQTGAPEKYGAMLSMVSFLFAMGLLVNEIRK